MKKILLVSIALLLAACETPPPPQPAPPPPPPVQPQKPPPAKPPPPPLPVNAGPLKPGGVEVYMDGLERALRNAMRGTSVRIMRRADSIAIDIPNSLLFAGEAIGSHGQTTIAALARVLRVYDHTFGQVNGYTDTLGAFADNVEASLRRARSVCDGLIANKVAAGRFTAHGFGPAKLRIHTADQVAEPRNRRIVISILPKPE